MNTKMVTNMFRLKDWLERRPSDQNFLYEKEFIIEVFEDMFDTVLAQERSIQHLNELLNDYAEMNKALVRNSKKEDDGETKKQQPKSSPFLKKK